jgi:hypothetical protein
LKSILNLQTILFNKLLITINLSRIPSFIENKFIDHFIVFLLIANSGMPFFTNNPNIIVWSMLFTIFFVRDLRTFSNKYFLITIAFLVILIIGQTITIGNFDVYTTATLIVRWTFPFVVLAAVREKFPKLFVDVIYFLTLISLLIFIPSLFFPQVDTFLASASRYFEQISKSDFYSYNSNIIIYTIPTDYLSEGLSLLKRNSGPFWEAGGFGSFLMVALLFSIIIEHQIFTRRNVVFLIAIITTYSTAVFIGLAVLLLGYGIWIVKNKFVQIISPFLIIIMSYLAFTHLDFVSERINRSINYYQNREVAKFEKRDRMVSAIVDIETFVHYPIFGTGREVTNRFGSKSFDVMEHRNNGVTDFLVKYGLIFFLYYFYMMRQTFICFASPYIEKKERWGNIALSVILVIGFSQILFQMSVFMAIYYCSTFLKKERDFTKKILVHL